MVRCKLICESLAGDWVHFRAVMQSDAEKGDTEAASFCSATPGGTVQLLITNEAAKSQFAIGESYYADFSSAK